MTFVDLLNGNGIFCDGDWIEKKDQDPNGAVRLIQLADIGVCEFKDKSSRFITEDKAKELCCTYLHKGDILIARLPDPLGRACIFPLDGKYITAVDVAILRTGREDIDSKYLVYMINSPQFRNAIKQYETGTTRKRISRRNLEKIEFDLPEVSAQKNIVAKIEELFSKLDASVAELKTAKERLKVYRQAALTRAFAEIENTVDMDSLAVMIDPQPSHRTPAEVADGVPYIGVGDIDYIKQTINFDEARKVAESVLLEHRERYALEPPENSV